MLLLLSSELRLTFIATTTTTNSVAITIKNFFFITFEILRILVLFYAYVGKTSLYLFTRLGALRNSP
jgi:hypothetical protein